MPPKGVFTYNAQFQSTSLHSTHSTASVHSFPPLPTSLFFPPSFSPPPPPPPPTHTTAYSGTSTTRQSSLEIINSPISSDTRRKVTVQMCMERKDILRDINLKGRASRSRMYKSYPPFPPQRSGIQFQLRFYPTSLQKSAAAALYIDIVSVRDSCEASIPALDITVSVSDSKALLNGERATSDKAEEHIAFHRHLCSSGYLFEKEYECIALFPQLVTHRALQRIVGSAVVIQVIMEYSS